MGNKNASGVIGNKGNVKASGTVGNRGNNIPKEYSNVPLDFAQKAVDQYTAESTYIPSVNATAHKHLDALNNHMNQLAAAAPENRQVRMGKVYLQRATEAHHSYDMENALENMSKLHGVLQDMHASEDAANPQVSERLSAAHGSAKSYLNAYHPAQVVPSKGGVSVAVDTDYRAATDPKYAAQRKKDLAKAEKRKAAK